MDNEKERTLDVVMYLVSLVQSAFRLAKNQNPFDFESLPTAEFIMSKSLPFFEDENVDYKKAHDFFLQTMFENGWVYGDIEDFANRIHHDLVAWEKLTEESKNMYGFTAGLVCSAKGFYRSLKEDFENDFIDSFSPEFKGRAKNALSRINLNH